MQLPSGKVVRLTRSEQGLELYFPPLRDPVASLTLALFGLSCLIPGLFAAMIVVPLTESGPAGLLSVVLMSVFILPFVVFGLVFIGLAVFQLVNSLTVRITESQICIERRVLGMMLRGRRVASASIVAIEPVAAARYWWSQSEKPRFSLVATTRECGLRLAPDTRGVNEPAPHRDRKITIAENLRGETLMDEVRSAIVKSARLERLAQARE
jgi:hypothetical protein